MDLKQFCANNNISLEKLGDIGEVSDGFHTFNSLYDQRLVLFAALVNTFSDQAWKSRKHSDGKAPFRGGWFIVGINTPEGPYTYHYEDKDWDLFRCKELELAPAWDGHTDKDVRRVLSLHPVSEEGGKERENHKCTTDRQGKKSTMKGNASMNKSDAIQERQQEYDIQEKQDFTSYYQECRERITDKAAQEYLSFRGISIDTAAAYGIGFDPEWRSPTAIRNEKNPPASPRLIIPTTSNSYIARDTRRDIKEFAKMKEGAAELFNVKALYNEAERPVFITEGEIDALSIIEAGAEAVGLGRTSNTAKLLKKLTEERTGATLILCLDNDEQPGRKACRELAEGLDGLNISYVTADICGGHKDPNEALTADREAFTRSIQEAEHSTAAKPDAVGAYINRLMAGEIDRFKEGASRKTGFDNLDTKAGGIYPGLYVLGAISSLGKTTFVHQMADQMAAMGEHVLFFSLEQSRLEMVSKSLARMTAQRMIAQQDIKKAKTSLEIRGGCLSREVLEAVEAYTKAVGERLSVIEGNFSCNVAFIGEYTRQYIKRNGVKPIVIVDYLQILQGDPTQRQTTKELIDTNVTELKRISRGFDIPVFLISSLNRSNYLTPVDFESLKESGGIEYTSDVIWGLQLQCLNDPLFDKANNNIKEKREKIKEAKAENPRRIELVCLKNRYGVSSYKAAFDYYPQYDLFKSGEQDDGNKYEKRLRHSRIVKRI